MSYIQDKLDELLPIQIDILYNEDGQEIVKRQAIVNLFTDYHNHIVEKIDDAIKNQQITNSYAEGILEGMMHCKHLILQDTNPKE